MNQKPSIIQILKFVPMVLTLYTLNALVGRCTVGLGKEGLLHLKFQCPMSALINQYRSNLVKEDSEIPDDQNFPNIEPARQLAEIFPREK